MNKFGAIPPWESRDTDGNIYTCAGIAAGIVAGIDLALAWVEEDCGNALASEVARELVLFCAGPEAKLSSACH